MKNYLLGCASLLFFMPTYSQEILNGDSQYAPFKIESIPVEVADSAWQVNLRGNHRAIVEVGNSEKGEAVKVFLPWRRADLRANTKKVIVVDAQTNQEINNVIVTDFSNESANVIFEPVSGKGIYYVYYMPYHFREGSNDARYGKPWNDYLPAVYTADRQWRTGVAMNPGKAKLVRFESRSRFESFTPMGLIASQKEMERIKTKYPTGAIIYTEDRAFPIRLKYQLPLRWVNKTPFKGFKGTALQNEYYVWQLGVWAAHQQIEHVHLSFSDLVSKDNKIAKESITCFNQEGTGWDGKPLKFDIHIDHGNVQALWCGVQIPENAQPGVYKGHITVESSNEPDRVIPVEITVENKYLADKGDNDLWRHARLRWLNSTIGMDNKVTKPYRPMQVEGQNIVATDKTLSLASNGLPASIHINNKEVLAAPVRFVIVTDKGNVAFDAQNLKVKKEDDGLISWTSLFEKDGIRIENKATMEFDGYVHYNLNVSTSKDQIVKDIRLETIYSPYASAYYMGMGTKGGDSPEKYKWNWQKGPWDSYWMGNAKAGLHVEFRGGTYNGPLLNDYKPEPPRAWSNYGRGSFSLRKEKDQSITAIASTGRDTLFAKGRDYEFDLLITPLKPLNPAKHFSERYYHNIHTNFDKAAEEGANICNIHHAKPLNPVINYPFIVQDSLKAFINHEHEFNRKVKLYYTIRELTNHCAEIFALKSLNNEIIDNGVGYGAPWHHEHLIDGYRGAWYAELPHQGADASVAMASFSRWINYYLEGLRWMFENYKLDGIYMDDVSFDRPVMKRIRKIIEQYRPNAVIDLHSNTAYAILSANQYTGFFPYVDRLWFGENFMYDWMTPAQWLIQFSGIPFGPMSEMLMLGGNRFLGMVYGTTARHSYGKWNPGPVWKLWKDFGITEAKMLGYWDEECPLTTYDKDIKATAYVKSDKVLISIGNFSKQDKNAKLTINWDAIHMDPSAVRIYAPEVEEFQHAREFQLNEEIPIKKKEGWLIIVEKK